MFGRFEGSKIQPFTPNLFPNSRRKTLSVVIWIGSNTMTNLRAADIEQRCVGNCNILRYILKGIAGSRIDDDTIAGKDVLAAIPRGKAFPIISSDDKHKFAVGMFLSQGLERIIHIGRTRQIELAVTNFHAWHFGNSKSRQMQPFLVIKEMLINLERVLRRNQQPHFIHKSAVGQSLRQADMSQMNGIEATAVDSGLFHFGMKNEE